ncbi:MAG TPA: PadR family transcriptional regulator [Streptosporangiaceae bacterium]
MPGKRRKVANPLALAVLGTLRQQPMHPYEMAATMRSQGKERSIKLNYGSLYTVVDNLAKHGYIEAMEASREGRRPERTVYRLTDAGRAELEKWMAELLGTPVKEYPQFEAALALLGVLEPSQVLELLRERVPEVEKAISAERAELAAFPWLPRLFILENEYHLAMQEAELAWVRGVVADLENGSFPGMDDWARWHETGELPAGIAAMAAAALDEARFPASDATTAGSRPDGERSS